MTPEQATALLCLTVISLLLGWAAGAYFGDPYAEDGWIIGLITAAFTFMIGLLAVALMF